ncbi:unnamed protein product [Cyclocybe aegerita]|uniref:Uncharacterized protein n=1 Tax=Cyclocybe aegerita TaxID=1973307 RepID=A0A8S0WVD3_CYCAE|nr:unnamed protein product [Cyclocybe aegerita]
MSPTRTLPAAANSSCSLTIYCDPSTSSFNASTTHSFWVLSVTSSSLTTTDEAVSSTKIPRPYETVVLLPTTWPTFPRPLTLETSQVSVFSPSTSASSAPSTSGLGPPTITGSVVDSAPQSLAIEGGDADSRPYALSGISTSFPVHSTSVSNSISTTPNAAARISSADASWGSTASSVLPLPTQNSSTPPAAPSPPTTWPTIPTTIDGVAGPSSSITTTTSTLTTSTTSPPQTEFMLGYEPSSHSTVSLFSGMVVVMRPPVLLPSIWPILESSTTPTTTTPVHISTPVEDLPSLVTPTPDRIRNPDTPVVSNDLVQGPSRRNDPQQPSPTEPYSGVSSGQSTASTGAAADAGDLVGFGSSSDVGQSSHAQTHTTSSLSGSTSTPEISTSTTDDTDQDDQDTPPSATNVLNSSATSVFLP